MRTLEEIERELPATVQGVTLWAVAILFAVLLIWSCFGKLDIVVSAQGRLNPSSYVKLVQAPDTGRVAEVLVREGMLVKEGDVIIRMSQDLALADKAKAQAQLSSLEMQLQRIEAERAGGAISAASALQGTELEVQRQLDARRRKFKADIDADQRAIAKARHELEAAQQTLTKLQAALPVLEEQARNFRTLADEGLMGQVSAQEKQREWLATRHDAQAQASMVEAARRALAMGEAKLLQTEAAYQAALSDTALEAANSIRQAALDVERETVKTALLEVRAPKSGVVKDLGVHTVGQVVQQGAVMLSVVPEDDALFVEAKLNNDDIGYVKSGQAAKVKVAAFQFQKFGLLPAVVEHVGQDAAEVKSGADPAEAGTYKVHLKILKSAISDVSYIESRLRPGMLVTAELHCGQRTVIEYLLSPVSKTLLESARER